MYQAHGSTADAIRLAMSQKPGRTAATIAGREGIKAGVSNLGDTFYKGGNFTGSGGVAYGAGAGALSSAINGGSASDIASSGAIGGASSGLSNYAAGQGGSAAGSGALGGSAGFIGGMVKDTFRNHHQPRVSGAEMGGRFVGAISSAVLGPLGGIVGAGVGKLLNQNPHKKKVRGSVQIDGPLFKYDQKTKRFVSSGKVTGFDGSGFHYGAVPEKYWEKITQAAQRRHKYMDRELSGKTFDLNPRQAFDMQHMVNSSILDLPTIGKETVQNWLRDPSYNIPNIDKIGKTFQSNPNAYLTRYGKIDDSSLYDGMDEGGDTAPVSMYDYLHGAEDDNSAKYDNYDGGE